MTERCALSRTNKNLIRGATLIHRNDPMHLAGYQHNPGIYTLAFSVAEYSANPLPLTAPSAAHLTTCFLPDSQHHRLSVKASSPLSPLQRFTMLNFLYYIINVCTCQEKISELKGLFNFKQKISGLDNILDLLFALDLTLDGKGAGIAAVLQPFQNQGEVC